MKMLDHPNCMRMVDSFDDDRMLIMVLSKLMGGALIDRVLRLRTFSEAAAAALMRDAAAALSFIHRLGIAHRDIKPDNFIFDTAADSATLVLADFGLSAMCVDAQMQAVPLRDQCGTAGFIAPEVLLKQPYDTKVDMWALGVILYMLLSGLPPFFEETQEELFDRIRTADYSFPNYYWKEVSEEAKGVVRSLMCASPKNRLSAEQLLQHPWLKPPVSAESTLLRTFSATHRQSLLVLHSDMQVAAMVATRATMASLAVAEGNEFKEEQAPMLIERRASVLAFKQIQPEGDAADLPVEPDSQRVRRTYTAIIT